MPQKTNENQAIRNLQTYLRQLSYHSVGIPAPPINGYYGAETRESVRAFQKEYEIPITGIVNQAVWDLLYAAYRGSLAAHTSPQRVNIFPSYPCGCELKPGSKGFAVAAIQYLLGELERFYGMIGNPGITGTYDENTRRAVMEFQKQNALRPSGNVDWLTWNAIADQNNMISACYMQE